MAESFIRNRILSLSIKEKHALYTAYMPFVENGGLFISTNHAYKMGQEVFILLSLMEETENIPIAGKVVWLTSVGGQGCRTIGIGVQFSEQDGELARSKVETYLAGSLESEDATNTM